MFGKTTFDKIRKVLNDNGYSYAALIHKNYKNRDEYFVCLDKMYTTPEADTIFYLLSDRKGIDTNDITICSKVLV